MDEWTGMNLWSLRRLCEAAYPLYRVEDAIELAFQKGQITYTEHEYLCGRCNKYGEPIKQPQ